MINTYKQRIPGGMDTNMPPVEFKFESLEQLINNDAINRYSKLENFNKFVMDDNCLMAIYENGKKWWVLGYISIPELICLPTWEGPIYE